MESQAEAVLDAVLLALTAGNTRAYARARHVGEWCARMAAELPSAPAAAFMRRCGVLARLDPRAFDCIAELREYAPVVRAFQRGAECTETRVIAVAEEFDSLVFDRAKDHRCAPSDALRMLIRSADEGGKPIIDALRKAMRNAPEYLFGAA